MANKRHMKVYRIEINQDLEDQKLTCRGDITMYLAAPNLDAAKAWLLDYTLNHKVHSLSIFCIKGLSFYVEKTCQINIGGGTWEYGSLNVCVDQAPADSHLNNQWHPNAY